jgi:hypothetical protein
VAHSGSPSERCTPSRESCEAVEWQCKSTREVIGVSLSFSLLSPTEFAICRANL